MKTKIAITVALCALFVAVPSATPKGRAGAGLVLGLSCNEVDSVTDSCSVTGTGLSGTGTFAVSVTDSCGDTLIATSVNAPSFSIPINFSDTASCPITNVTAQLFVSTHGKLTLLQTATFNSI